MADVDPNSDPDTPDDATAGRVTRAIVRRGNNAYRLFEASAAAGASYDELHILLAALNALHGTALLLRALTDTSPARADRAACELWSAWKLGDVVPEDLAAWAVEYGQQPAFEPTR